MIGAVHRLGIPLPFAMDAVNAWLVDSGDGWLLIDTAMPTGACWRALDRKVQDTGVPWRDISTALITHMHPDHCGLIPQVVEASGAQVAMHAADAEILRHFAVEDAAEHWNGVALNLAGTPAEMYPRVDAAFRLLTVKFPRITVDRTLQGGERFGGFEVIATPGHSPGHLCLYEPDRKLLFSGDHLLESTSPNIGWLPDADPLGDYLASLAQLRFLDVETVMPGHGAPFTDHRGWIDRTIAHHSARCDRLSQLIKERPRTAHELTRDLWDRELDPIHYRFAVFEVLAHLVALERSGRVRRDGIVWYPGTAI